MSLSKPIVAFFLAVALVATASGCGGGDDEGTGGDVDLLVPGKRDYLIQADTICQRAQQQIESEAEVALGIDSGDFRVLPSGEIAFKAGRRPSPQRIERFGTEVVIPALREQLADLRALRPPRGDEQAVAEIYDAAEEGLDRLAAEPGAFDDRGAVRRELSRARRLARRYGFFDCGRYSGP